MSAADSPLLDGGTQWHALSAADKQPTCSIVNTGPRSMLGCCADDNVVADGEDEDATSYAVVVSLISGARGRLAVRVG